MNENFNKPRIMYWPNETKAALPDSLQVGGRYSFESMEKDGTIGALNIYSYRLEKIRFDSDQEFEKSALKEITDFRPDILFVQHLAGSGVRRTLWNSIRNLMPGVSIIYHDDDPFDRVVKRIDEPTSGILKFCDLALISGLGSLADLFHLHGAKNIGYMPSCFDKKRFGRINPLDTPKKHEIVMIGSCGRRRKLKFAYLPGGRRRAQLVERLSEDFGDDFAIYGGGWNFSCSKGPRPYVDQELINQTGRITVNWDHFDEIDYYFSDRLPIALSSAVPHVTTLHRGYDRIFKGCPGLYLCADIKEATETCRWLVSRPSGELLDEGLAAREWAFRHLEAEKVFREAVKQAVRAHAKRICL